MAQLSLHHEFKPDDPVDDHNRKLCMDREDLAYATAWTIFLHDLGFGWFAKGHVRNAWDMTKFLDRDFSPQTLENAFKTCQILLAAGANSSENWPSLSSADGALVGDVQPVNHYLVCRTTFSVTALWSSVCSAYAV